MTRFEKLKEYINSRGGKLLSSSIHWNNGNFSWVCDRGHVNSSKMQMLRRKSWCSKCSLEDTREKVLSKLKDGYSIIEFSLPKYKIICDKGHKISMTPYHIVNGNGCGVCFSIKRKTTPSNLLLSLQDVNDRLGKIGFKFKSEVYSGLNKKYTIECSNGHLFSDKRLDHVLSGASGCPYCNNSFASEVKFRKSVEKILNATFPKSRPDWLINPETNRRLELDCYNEDLKLAFEYDGHFHFEVRKGLNNNLENTKKLDALKDKLCSENGVHLIRVPYFLKDADYYNKIIEGLKYIYGDKYWLVIRAAEGGPEVPEEIKQARAEARAKVV